MLKRALLEIGRPYRCEGCGNDGSWRGEPLTPDVDHIDGDYYNDEASNLRFLCPNCHRQTDNFAGRSRNKFVASTAGCEAAAARAPACQPPQTA